MSSEQPNWPVLTPPERRVLGVLVEKAKTTPDVYPLSVNSLVTGANQKSNRDPLMNMSEENVEDTLAAMQPKGYVTRIQGGRVERWRHNLYDLWSVNKVELAILAELLLRGPQTEGELRQRASRMEPIESLDDLRAALKPLAERKLVIFVGEPGRRGTLIAHGFHSPKEIDAARLQASADPAAAAPTPAPDVIAQLQSELRDARQQIAQLNEQMRELRDAMQYNKQQLQALKESLGA